MKNEGNAGPTPSESQQSEQQKSLLVVKVPSGMHQEDVESLSKYMEPMGTKLGAEVMICPDGMDAQWQQNLGPLVDAITAQTEAITRLAMSNEALVQAMAEDEQEDPDEPPARYMDGSRVL